MSVFHHALVALSNSESDIGLLNYAAQVARLDDYEEFFFVHAACAHPHSSQSDDIDSLLDGIQAEVGAHFGLTDRQVKFAVDAGPRLDVILKTAVQRQSDVILLGHRKDRSGNRSLARRLAMIAPCSVWLAPEGAPARISNILVPVDFSSHSGDALSLATAIAAAQGLKQCTALHVFFDRSTVRYDEHVAEILGNEQAAFDKLVASVDCHGVHVEPASDESALVPEAILRVANRCGSDLIVMNTRGRSRAAAVLLGSITSETMATTTIPLLAVKHFGSRMRLRDVLVNHRFWDEPTPKTS